MKLEKLKDYIEIGNMISKVNGQDWETCKEPINYIQSLHEHILNLEVQVKNTIHCLTDVIRDRK